MNRLLNVNVQLIVPHNITDKQAIDLFTGVVQTGFSITAETAEEDAEHENPGVHLANSLDLGDIKAAEEMTPPNEV